MQWPSTIEGLLLLIGAVFLLIAIVGGGFEISAIKIPGVGKYPRIGALIVGTVCVFLALHSILSGPIPSQPIGTVPTLPVPTTSTVRPTAAVPSLSVRLFQAVSSTAQHPEGRITVPEEYKLISGGAQVIYQGAGNLITASYPEGDRTWVARSKDHLVASPATIEVWAVALYDPHDDWEVQIRSAISSPDSHPMISVGLPDGYVMTGGGATANWVTRGSLLTASYPEGARTWVARSKDHGLSEATTLTVYVIGIRPRNGAALPQSTVFKSTSGPDAHPSASASVDDGYVLAGGGALVDWHGAGNLLTASYPGDQVRWIAASKDHVDSDPAVITAYAIGLRY